MDLKIKLKLIFGLLALTLTIGSNFNNTQVNHFEIEIKKVIDGDTFVGKNNATYRIWGIDTFELNALNVQKRFWALKAKFKLWSLIQNQKVDLYLQGVDKYQRFVTQVKINQIDIGFHLITLGLAKVKYISIMPKSPFYTENHAYYHQLLKAQYEAYLNKVGLWK